MTTEAQDQIRKLTECCICFKTFTDPRMLPCIHTFCLECIKQTSEAAEKQRGEKMPCPLCRKEFSISAEGMNGIQKNFFMQHLMDVTRALQLGQKPVIDCDICKVLYVGDEEKTKEATMRCLECGDNFCDMCSKAHKLQKLSKTHNIVKFGSETEEDIRKMQPTKNCADHNEKPLDFYCADCKTILCVSCFVENHASHKCKDVTTIQKEFRQTIETDAMKISICAEGILSKGRMIEQKKTEVLLNIANAEDEIRQSNLELKEMIDSHTNSLLEDLSRINQEQIKKFATDKEEIERIHTILKSFETYCTELISKGSASDVCSCVDELHSRSDELKKDHEAFIGRPFQMTEVSFKDSEFRGLLSNPSSNIVGQIEYKLFECALSSQLSSASLVYEPDHRESNNVAPNATDERKKENTADEILRTLFESEQHILSSIQSDSRERPENVFTTSDMRAKVGQVYEDHENCGITFSEALARYKEILLKIRDQANQINLLTKEQTDKLHRQFHHLRRIQPDKLETQQWRCFEQNHYQLLSIKMNVAAEGYRSKSRLERANNISENMLQILDAMR